MNERAVVGIRHGNHGDENGESREKKELAEGDAQEDSEVVKLGKGVVIEGKASVEGSIGDWGIVGVGAIVGRGASVGEVNLLSFSFHFVTSLNKRFIVKRTYPRLCGFFLA